MNNKRILTPYEKNQLMKHGVDFDKLLSSDSPVEYVTGYVEFMGSDFFVSPDVLIPRVETEELVQMAIKKSVKLAKNTIREVTSKNSNQCKTLQIIDVGTGSGAIAISIAKKIKEENLVASFEVTASDISEAALSIAKKNFENIDCELPIKFIKSNLLSDLDSVDLIIANLPYIPSERIKSLDNSVKNFEPHLALDGGPDGLSLVRKLLKKARPILSKNGLILLELDITHTKEKMKEFENDWKVEIIQSENGGVYFAILSHCH